MAATKTINTRAVSNVDLWNAVRDANPSFKSHTAQGTAELFTERGWSTITQAGMQVVNEFWELAMPFFLNIVNISHARDVLEDRGFGEYFDTPYGGYIQRMSVNSVKPISPRYRDLQNGPGPDPFVVRKPTANNRFFQFNFDYQSMITMPDQWENKRIFTSEYGMSEFLAGVMTGLENGYIQQKYLNKLECLNAALNSTTHPLKETQTISVQMGDVPTEAELLDFLLQIKNTISIIETTPQTGVYNAMGFESTQDISRLKLLVRLGYKNRIDLMVARNSYHTEALNLPIDVIEVPNFGGLVPTTDGSTPAYPVYDALGAEIGFATTQGASVPDVTNVIYTDPNANTIGIIADKGAIFECRQNPYQVEPIRNPRGLYTNFWAAAPNNAILYDPLYNFIKIVKAA